MKISKIITPPANFVCVCVWGGGGGGGGGGGRGGGGAGGGGQGGGGGVGWGGILFSCCPSVPVSIRDAGFFLIT